MAAADSHSWSYQWIRILNIWFDFHSVPSWWTAEVTHYPHHCHLRTLIKSFVAYTTQSLTSDCILKVVALYEFSTSYVAQHWGELLLWFFRVAYVIALLSFVKLRVKRLVLRSSLAIWNTWISPGSVATQLRWGGNLCHRQNNLCQWRNF